MGHAGLCHFTGSRRRSSLCCKEEEGVKDVITTDLFGRRSDEIWPAVEFNGGDVLSTAGRVSMHGEEEFTMEKC
jgi:hypothetical protein